MGANDFREVNPAQQSMYDWKPPVNEKYVRNGTENSNESAWTDYYNKKGAATKSHDNTGLAVEIKSAKIPSSALNKMLTGASYHIPADKMNIIMNEHTENGKYTWLTSMGDNKVSKALLKQYENLPATPQTTQKIVQIVQLFDKKQGESVSSEQFYKGDDAIPVLITDKPDKFGISTLFKDGHTESAKYNMKTLAVEEINLTDKDNVKSYTLKSDGTCYGSGIDLMGKSFKVSAAQIKDAKGNVLKGEVLMNRLSELGRKAK